MKFETVLYIVAAIIAIGFILLGGYLLNSGGVLNAIGGIFFLVLGFIIGVSVYGDRWDFPY